MLSPTGGMLRVFARSELSFSRPFIFREGAQTELARLAEVDTPAIQGTRKFGLWRLIYGEFGMFLRIPGAHALDQQRRERRIKAEKCV